MSKCNSTIKKESSQLKRTAYGVGYNSGGKYKSRINGVRSNSYEAWRSMLRRCYSDKSIKRQPAYIDCKVDEKWHDFQVFAEWYESHRFYGLGYQLDKDLLSGDSKIYSEYSCALIPARLNTLINEQKPSTGEYPKGVGLHKRVGRLHANIRMNGRKHHLGYFNCPQEAHQAYVIAKEAYVKEVANEWRGQVDERVYEALMRWTVKNNM